MEELHKKNQELKKALNNVATKKKGSLEVPDALKVRIWQVFDFSLLNHLMFLMWMLVMICCQWYNYKVNC